MPDFYIPRSGDLDFLAGLGASPGFLFFREPGASALVVTHKPVWS
jgi:hypothetical protein